MKSGSTMAFSRFPRWFVSAATGILTLMAGSIATAQNQTNNIQPDQFQAGQTVFSQSLSSQESTNPRAGWDGLDVASARLISAVTASGSGETIPMGLEFDLAPGWKIYWRTPGDAGLPPVPDWSKSDNVADVVMHWPVPERFEIFDIGTLGYGGEIIFPLTVTPEIPGAPIRLAGTASGLVNMGVMIGPMLLQPAVGALLDHYWTGEVENGVRVYGLDAYQNGFSLMLGWLVLALLLMFFTRETHCKQIA